MYTRIRGAITALTLSASIGAGMVIGIPSIAGATDSYDDTETCYEQVTEYQYQKQTREHRRESVEAEWGPWTDWSWWSPASTKWSTTVVDVLEGPAQHGGDPYGTFYREYRYAQNGQTRTINGAEKPCPVPVTATGNYECAVRSTDPAQTAGVVVFKISDFGLSWRAVFNGATYTRTDTLQIAADIEPALAAGNYPWSVYDGETLVDEGVIVVEDNCVDDTPVTATVPTSSDPCGTTNDTYTIPSKTGVVYKVGGVIVGAGTHPGSGSVTVTAEAITGYTLEGANTWTFTFTNNACDDEEQHTV